MFKYTENLSGWENMSETEKCYLDGSYFNAVFKNYPGLLPNPLKIKYVNGNKYINMYQTNLSKRMLKMPLLLRTIIETENSRHSNLLILDLSGNKIYRFEPLGVTSPHFQQTNKLISDYLSEFFTFNLEILPSGNIYKKLDEKNPVCEKSGFCVAYCILYAYCFLNQLPFNGKHIRRFVSKLISVYGEMTLSVKDVEYGFLNGTPTSLGSVGVGAGLGGLAGAVIGGPSGLVLGAIGGGLVGSAV